MRYTSLILPVFSVALLVVACASESAPTTDTQPAEPAPAAMPPSAATPPPAKQCVDKCASDADCVNSCPSETNGVQCCDTATGKCFKSPQSTCPAPAQTTKPPTSYGK